MHHGFHGLDATRLQAKFGSSCKHIYLYLLIFTVHVPEKKTNLGNAPTPISYHLCFTATETKRPTFEVLCQTADEQLFNKIVSGANNVLHTLLPPLSTASQHYNLRRRTHTYSLPGHDSYLCDCNFITNCIVVQRQLLTPSFYL